MTPLLVPLEIAARPTIGFDVTPNAGGPGRYVAALAKGLADAGWNVVYPLDESPASDGNAAVTTSREQRRSAALVNLLPRAVRYAAGFARHAWRLSRRIAASRMDIFHVQHTGCEEMPLGARIARRRQVLGTFHVDSTTDLLGERGRLTHRSLERVSNRCLHRAIAVSHATKLAWVRRTGIPEHRIEVIHNGIDPQRIRRQQSRSAARKALELPLEGTIIGALGRLDPVKGYPDLIEALALLRDAFPTAYLAIAGNGPQRDELAALAASRGLAKRVILLGFCSDVNLFLDACDVFALPSLAEALPFALLEAMAHELPAVGTNVGGVGEVIEAHETGFLVPPRDAAALAMALSPLLESSELRSRMGLAGRCRIVERFQESDMVQRTLAVYESLLKRDGRRSGRRACGQHTSNSHEH